MRTAFVTGATGFIGRRLVEMLKESGWHTIAAKREYNNLTEYLDYCFAKNIDLTFHLASLFLGKHETHQIAGLIDSNVAFGTKVIDGISRLGCRRFVNAGTSWQHPHPRNLYAATKQAFESIIDYYVQSAGMRAITLKLHDTYGPGDTRPKLVKTLAEAVANPPATPMPFVPAETPINLVHVDDVCRAFIAAGERLMNEEHAGHEKFSVAGEPTTVGEVAGIFERISGKTLPIAWGALPARWPTVEPWVAHGIPGWAPTVGLKQGIAGLLQ